MKRLLLLLLLFSQANAQTTNKKIKVILLGTFHYGATSDKGKTSFPDLFSTRRQSELDTIARELTKAGVNKIYIERPVEWQPHIDSLYRLYTQKKLTDTNVLRAEEIQVGMRTAALSGASLVAVDYRQELPYAELAAYEQAHKNDTINPYHFFDEATWPFKVILPRLSQTRLPDYYIRLNDVNNRQAAMFDYLQYAPSYGVGNDYPGIHLAASWYDRNLKIFTNILRATNLHEDKVILVLFGSSHTALLRHFFEDHPYFELVEVDQVLK